MLAYLFVLLAVAFKLNLLTHAFAFTPVGAALLFFGARGPRRHAWIPLALLAGSDIYMTKVAYAYPLTADHFVTWAWYAAVLLMGGLLRKDARPLRVVGASLAAAVSFFVVSNFAVWALWVMYPKTLAGLASCYAAALPFFRNDVMATLVFAAIMFGAAALLPARAAEHKAAA